MNICSGAARCARLAAVVLVCGSGGATAQPVAHGQPRLAFMSAHEGNPEIYSMRLDGTDLRRLTHRELTDGYPAWSPDGANVAFYAYEDATTWSLYRMDESGANRVRLTHEVGVRDSAPAWHPHGSQLAFCRMQGQSSEIWVMRPDGTGPKRLGRLEGLGPRWSPDGRRIAFFSRDPQEVFVASADGTHPRQLTRNEVNDKWPSWSPDGQQIAYMSGRRGHHQIYVMNADGSGRVQLTDDAHDNWQPVWSPDGSAIAYASFRDDVVRVFVMNADGTSSRCLTPFSDYAMHVAWRGGYAQQP